MDPVSVIGLVGTCVTIIARAGAVANDIHDLANRYKNVAKDISLITIQLSTFKAAIVLLSSCLERRVHILVDQTDIVLEVRASLDACSSIMAAVQGHVDKVGMKSSTPGTFNFKARMKHLWDEKSVSDCVRMLEVQVQALSFLIQVLQLSSASDQRSLLSSKPRRGILDRARDDASSVAPSADAMSVASERTADGDSIVGPFAFDDEVLGSSAYKSAFFRLMRRELSNESGIDGNRHGDGHEQYPFTDSGAVGDSVTLDQLPSRMNGLLVAKSKASGIAQPSPETLHLDFIQPSEQTDESTSLQTSIAASTASFSDDRRSSYTMSTSKSTLPTQLSESAPSQPPSLRDFRDQTAATNLYDASEQGDVELISWMLAEGANVHAGRHSSPPVHIAALRGHVKAVKLLLDNGAESNTLLNVALANEDADLISLLLATKERQHVNAMLVSACKDNKTDSVALLLRAGAQVNHADATGRTSLHYAAQNGHESVVDQLFKARAAVNWSDSEGWTPLIFACFKGSGSLVEKLVLAGADIAHKSTQNWTPLHVACQTPSLPVVQFLLNSGVDIEARGGEKGSAPLAIAARAGATDIAKLLLQRGANIDLIDTNGSPALLKAIENGHVELARYLLKSGARNLLEEKDEQGDTALLRACRKDTQSTTAIEQLLKLGVNTYATDRQGHNALGIAVDMLKPQIVGVLLRHGAVPDGEIYQRLRAAGTTRLRPKDSPNPTLREMEARKFVMMALFDAAPPDLRKVMKKYWLRQI